MGKPTFDLLYSDVVLRGAALDYEGSHEGTKP